MENNNVVVESLQTTIDQEQKKKKKRFILFWFFLILICAFLIGLLVHRFLSSNNMLISGNLFPGTGEATPGTVPGLTEQQIKDEMQNVADASKFTFIINGRPTFYDGSSAGNINIENPTNNAYPFVVEIYLKGTDELLYNSGGILPGYHIDQVKLAIQLEKGEHDAIAYFNVYDPETNVYLGKAGAELHILVEN